METAGTEVLQACHALACKFRKGCIFAVDNSKVYEYSSDDTGHSRLLKDAARFEGVDLRLLFKERNQRDRHFYTLTATTRMIYSSNRPRRMPRAVTTFNPFRFLKKVVYLQMNIIIML